jgi:hypothetical protein
MFAGLIFAIVFIVALVLPRNTQTTTTQGINMGGHIAVDPNDGRGHIDDNSSPGGPYSVTPATSGPHWFGPTTAMDMPSPARWGLYDTGIPDEILVHNLEHGGIGIHYDCDDACPELVQELSDLIPSNPSQYILSPYVGLPKKIAITAWRHHLYLDEVDVEEIRKFIDEYKDRAPESVRGNSF